jgi:hypothetical protein
MSPLLFPVVSPALHGAVGWADEFVCIGLILLVLVIVVFLVRGGQKEGAEDVRTDDSEKSVEK